MDDPSEASDVVQEVFLKVFRKVGCFRGNSSLKTWIYRIAVNEAYNHHRWFSRHQRQEIALDPEDGAPSCAQHLADPGRSPFEQAADRETHMLVEAALEKLNPKFRTAVVLRDIEDLSYDDIAAVLDISLGTVKSRITRGREALRKILEERLEVETSVHWTARQYNSEFQLRWTAPSPRKSSAKWSNTWMPAGNARASRNVTGSCVRRC